MTGAELVRNLATFMLAGHETTAVALTWTLWLLAKYPYVQDQIASEAQATIGSSGAVEAQQVERRGSRPSAAPGAGLAQWSVASGTAHRARAASVANCATGVRKRSKLARQDVFLTCVLIFWAESSAAVKSMLGRGWDECANARGYLCLACRHAELDWL